jgi:hypothetical protein
MKQYLLAIDPGPTESGWVIIDRNYHPIDFGKEGHSTLFPHDNVPRQEWYREQLHSVVIEKPVCQKWSGASVSDTAMVAGVLAGQFQMLCDNVFLVNRAKVRGRLCGNRGNDSKCIAKLHRRFAPGVSNKGKGTKKEPGFFYGFTGDVWQAFALGTVFLDLVSSEDPKDRKYISERKL